MKRVVLVVGLLAACKGGDDADYKPVPGSGPAPIGSSPAPGSGPQDAGLSDAVFDSGVAISGQLCVLKDLRLFGTATSTANGCIATDLTGIIVSAGGRQTVASADGKFSLLAPEGSFTWRVTNPRSAKTIITPSSMIADANPKPVIPVVTDADYQSLVSGNGLEPNAEQSASAFIRVLDRGAPVAKVTATSNPATPQPAIYDNDVSANDWVQTSSTGSKGMVWLSGIQTPPAGGTGSVSITLKLPTPPAPTVANPTFSMAVFDQGITFFTEELE